MFSKVIEFCENETPGWIQNIRKKNDYKRPSNTKPMMSRLQNIRIWKYEAAEYLEIQIGKLCICSSALKHLTVK